ncbi:hypothetical protein U1Q18_033390 [Sarracenia purpurea var. burkii]
MMREKSLKKSVVYLVENLPKEERFKREKDLKSPVIEEKTKKNHRRPRSESGEEFEDRKRVWENKKKTSDCKVIENGPVPPPDLPPEFKNKIKESNGYEEKLLIQKRVTVSDLKCGINGSVLGHGSSANGVFVLVYWAYGQNLVNGLLAILVSWAFGWVSGSVDVVRCRILMPGLGLGAIGLWNLAYGQLDFFAVGFVHWFLVLLHWALGFWSLGFWALGHFGLLLMLPIESVVIWAVGHFGLCLSFWKLSCSAAIAGLFGYDFRMAWPALPGWIG